MSSNTTDLPHVEAPCFAVLPNRDNGAQSPPQLQKDPVVAESSRSSPASMSSIRSDDTIDHVQWSKDAWIALTRAFVRYPEGRSDLYRSTEKELFLRKYAERSERGTAMKWLKFHTAYVFAYAWGQTELPCPPSPLEDWEKPGRPVGGHLGRAFTNVMVRGQKGSLPYRRCAYDILMSKLGFPKAPPSFVEGALLDHKKALTRNVAVVGDEDECTLRDVESKIAEICNSVFGRVRFHHSDPIPSIRACQENGLANAGGFGELVTGFNQDRPLRLPEDDILFAMLEVKPGHVRELRFIDMTPRVTEFQSYVDELWTSRLGKGLHATPVPILEPLKVRIITKGQAAEYYRCIELQKLMHGALRKHAMFQCIGHPIEDDDWANTFQSKSCLAPDEFFVSGDYKAATDNLDPHLSEYTWQKICECVHLGWDHETKLSDTKYLALGRKALTGHILHYKQEEVQQSWGQLMGSPMSFPILCIVNAAATLVALKREYGQAERIRVNGDDIAFIANRTSYERWKHVTHLCGLDFSVGKNYTSREFIIMNSELRRSPDVRRWERRQSEVVERDLDQNDEIVETLTYEDHPESWKFEGFFNQCLAYNTVKKGVDAGQKKDTYWTDLSSISGEMLRGIPRKNIWHLYGIFFKTYKPVISEAPNNCNKWFPKSLGGMGLKLPPIRHGDGSIELVDHLAFASENSTKHGKGADFLETAPVVLKRQQKMAAYLACNTAVRLQRVSLKRPIVGVLGQLFKEVRDMSDAQVPRVLHRKLRNRECTPIMGGTTLLGYLLGVSDLAGGDFGPDGQWEPAPLGGGLPERSAVDHLRRAAELRQSYNKWLGRRSWQHGLEPMRIDHIFQYSEHLEMSSRIELLRGGVAPRSMD